MSLEISHFFIYKREKMVNIIRENSNIDIQVRLATLEDVNDLADYGCSLVWDSEGKTMDKAFISGAITRNLTNPKGNYYLIAFDNNHPEKKSVGTTMITHEMSVEQGGLICWIHAVYVSAEARRLGVFTKLYDYVRQKSEADPLVKCVRLYVEFNNIPAQKAYDKLGMRRLDSYEYNEIDVSGFAERC